PRNAIVAFPFRSEIELGRTLAIGFHRLRRYLFVLVAAEFQSPRTLSAIDEWRNHVQPLLQVAQLFALHFPALRIDPNLPPVIARDLHGAFGLNGLLVRVHSFDVDRNLVLRRVNVPRGTRVDVVTLPRDTHVVARDDLA